MSAACFRHVLQKHRQQSVAGGGGGADGVQSRDSNDSLLASIHDSHKFGTHTGAMTPTLHFHLAASINSNTGM